ncbi:3-oxoacyl-ACP synthase [Flammeovirga pectinis]|uniref:3-oxoacyl-ACP synthase n=1 Tax=Flammeovirga pectinis TaxID=2494373 RepID=A0A3Q9FLA1_9BACT|nr:3-oxoacyl-ACP synthase [Flammeovirga pectinis]AZQ62248.1 3-oxoacyl-ACP synthase [Flammeovirga pectinis]
MIDKEFKKRLKQHLKESVIQKIKTSENAMDSAQQAANIETRSTAGDKYDTSRAMMHLEKDKMAEQLAKSVQQLRVMEALKEEESETIQPGNLIVTPNGNYYLSISIGQVNFEDQVIFAISAQSPIGKLLVGKAKNDGVLFNGRKILIKNVL